MNIICNTYDCAFCINDRCTRQYSLKIVNGVCKSFEPDEDIIDEEDDYNL